MLLFCCLFIVFFFCFSVYWFFIFFFFFQAEDGIRDGRVTGVQTCALPISPVITAWTPHESVVDHAVITGGHHRLRVQYYQVDGWTELRLDIVRGVETSKIGRASCRERV